MMSIFHQKFPYCTIKPSKGVWYLFVDVSAIFGDWFKPVSSFKKLKEKGKYLQSIVNALQKYSSMNNFIISVCKYIKFAKYKFIITNL